MRLAGQRRLHGSPDAVWSALFDPDRLCRCIPGCRRMRRLDADHYEAVLNLPIPLLHGEYVAKVTAFDQQAPDHCQISLTSETGFGQVCADGALSLRAMGAATVLNFEGTVELGKLTAGGRLGIGGRLLAAPARALLERFFACLDSSLTSGYQGG